MEYKIGMSVAGIDARVIGVDKSWSVCVWIEHGVLIACRHASDGIFRWRACILAYGTF